MRLRIAKWFCNTWLGWALSSLIPGLRGRLVWYEATHDPQMVAAYERGMADIRAGRVRRVKREDL